MNEHDDGCVDEARERETVRKRWLWRNQKAFSSPAKGFTRLSTLLHPATLSSPPSPPTPSSSSPSPPRSPPPSAAALLGEADEDEEEARLQRAILRERERVAREEWEKKMKGDEGRTKHPMAMLLPKREARADVITPSTSTISSASSTQLADVTPREDKKKTKKGKKEEEAKESSLGDSGKKKKKEMERRTKVAPTKTLSYNVNLHAQVRLRKVHSFVYSSDERSPTSMEKRKRKSAAEKEKQEKKESKKKQKEKEKNKKKKQKQKRVGKSKDDSFILRPTAVAGGRPTRSASDASAVTPRLLSMISKPLDEDDVVTCKGNNHHNALDCTQTVALGPDLAVAAATDFEERSRMLALHRAQQRATWVPPLDMAKLAPPTTTTTSSQVRSPDSTIWSSSQSSSYSYSSSSSSWSSCDLSPCTSSSSNVLSPSARSTPTTPGSPTSSGSKRSGVMEWLHLRRKRGQSRGQSLPVRASRSDSNSSSSGLDGNDEEAEDDQEEATATATTTTAAVATTAIAIKAKLAGGLSGRSRRRRGVKEDEERVLFPGSAMAFVRREARYAVGLP
jgi:hypothetical protein